MEGLFAHGRAKKRKYKAAHNSYKKIGTAYAVPTILFVADLKHSVDRFLKERMTAICLYYKLFLVGNLKCGFFSEKIINRYAEKLCNLREIFCMICFFRFSSQRRFWFAEIQPVLFVEYAFPPIRKRFFLKYYPN